MFAGGDLQGQKSGWLGHNVSETKTPPPTTVYICTIFAHVTGDFRRASFPEKNL